MPNVLHLVIIQHDLNHLINWFKKLLSLIKSQDDLIEGFWNDLILAFGECNGFFPLIFLASNPVGQIAFKQVATLFTCF